MQGDTVGVIAPASPPVPEKLDRAVRFLKELGLEVKVGRSAIERHGYLAGNDEERLEDLHDMFEDRSVKAVICACGGYGTARIAENIDYRLIKSRPKIFGAIQTSLFYIQRSGKTPDLLHFTVRCSVRISAIKTCIRSPGALSGSCFKK